jgi:integrase/recombinase XerD
VIAAARDIREEVMISLEVMEGARSIEVSRVEFADIDRWQMTVRLTGKGDHVREVPLTQSTLDRIDKYVLEERGSRAGRLVQSRVRSVWNTEDGVKSHTIYVLVGRAFRRAGVAESGHALRHTAAYGLIEAGATVRHVQEFLGHQHLNTTEIYMKRAKLEEIRPFTGTKRYELGGVSHLAEAS